MFVRLANIQDLPKLKIIFKKVVNQMNKNKIKIWNDIYPFEEFEEDIKRKQLYLLCDDKEIFAVFALLDEISCYDRFLWKDKNSKGMYLARVGVNVDFLRKGYGTAVVNEAINIAKSKGMEYLRLTVANENIIAINLYLKNGFYKVDGLFKEYSPSQNKIIEELGFEKRI